MKVGDGMDPSSEMGPLVTAEHRDKVASYLDEGDVLVDGREGAPAEGFFLLPSLIDNLKPGMRAYDDEIFGPVLGVDARRDVRRGRAARERQPVRERHRDLHPRRRRRAAVPVRRQAGMVGINVPIPVPVAYYSFGGWKASLFGDRHIYGPEGIDFYTRGKVVTSRWPDPATSHVDLGFPQTR